MSIIPVIRVSHFAKAFGDHRAAQDISFTVHAGDIYGFLGRNGAGKSTTIRAMLGLIRPDGGTLEIFGQDIRRERNAILARTGSIVEKPDFYKYLSARRNLEVLSRAYGKRVTSARISDMLAFTGLQGREDDKVSGYSHGMRQRLGIAQALLHDPDLIILDEPTTGLDPQGIIDIRNLILRLRDELGKTIILSSHLLAEVELICNRMVIIDKGRTLIEGEVRQLLHADELRVEFQTDATTNVLPDLQLAFPGVQAEFVTGGEVHVTTARDMIPAINDWLSGRGVRVYGINARRKLEDYFLQILGN